MLGTNLVFTYKNWGKSRKTSVKIVGVPIDDRMEDLTIASENLYANSLLKYEDLQVAEMREAPHWYGGKMWRMIYETWK